MKQLPADLIIEKNKIATPVPWILLLDIVLTDDTELYICRNNENVTFNGQLYTAVPFDIEPTKASARGEIPTVTLRVSNVTRALQPYLEKLDGGIGSEITLRVVNTAHLDEDYSELEIGFDVLSASSEVYWVTFILGAPNPLGKRFPSFQFIADHCRWRFKSVECGYSGKASACKRTLSDCRLLKNSGRFGGFPGLSGSAARVV